MMNIRIRCVLSPSSHQIFPILKNHNVHIHYRWYTIGQLLYLLLAGNSVHKEIITIDQSASGGDGPDYPDFLQIVF